MSETAKISAAIITASDSRTIDDDVSGKRLKGLLAAHGAEVVHHSVVQDDVDVMRGELLSLTERDDLNLILTTGGTGLGPRDNTPEATLAVIEREVPGIAEAMRRETAAQAPFAILSRGVAGTRNGKLIINLPGSPNGVEECFAVIAPILVHAIRMVSGDTKH
ncbi:MAG TPA: MogA/MoaB family molybdenum cofactor biosynthesis protein [Pyrinomonadaceae bacterium]|nr:MogA/MoaB family molybdenum cofactor biosynthesis protein [Pyrinomonadaceae bacterium]